MRFAMELGEILGEAGMQFEKLPIAIDERDNMAIGTSTKRRELCGDALWINASSRAGFLGQS